MQFSTILITFTLNIETKITNVIVNITHPTFNCVKVVGKNIFWDSNW